MSIEELREKWNEKNAPKERVHHNSPEHDLQSECVRWFRYQYPFPKGLIYAVPNGGYRGDPHVQVGSRYNMEQAIRARLEQEGQLQGIPDLCIPIPRHGFGALYIEMKNGKIGRLNEHQKERIEQLSTLGNKVVVCRNVDQFVDEVRSYMD